MPVDLRTRDLFTSPLRTPLGCVDSAGFIQDSHWTAEGPRTIYYYTLTYILSGRCHYRDPAGRDVIFGPGDLFFCFPGQPHRFDPAEGEQFSEFWMAFSGPVFDMWRDAKMLDPERFHLRLEPIEYWVNRFESMFANVRGDAFGQLILISNLQAVLAEALSVQPSLTPEQGDDGWIARAKAVLDSVERVEDLDLATVAAQMGTSYSNFRRKFLLLSGMPPRRYHTARVMQQACEWVFASNRSVKEISDKFGFCNEFFFSRRFKQIIGMSPREFRASMRENPANIYRYTATDVMLLGTGVTPDADEE